MNEEENDSEDFIAKSYALTTEEIRKGNRSKDYGQNMRYALSKREQIFRDAYLAKGKRKKAARGLLELLRSILKR